MAELDSLVSDLRNRVDLSRDAIAYAAKALTNESLSPEKKASFLIALAEKGESEDEIAGFVDEMRSRAIPVPVQSRPSIIADVCGTGGDHSNTFNISTTVAIVLSAAGVTVAKHGNRAITSKSGSSEVLEALGVPINLSPSDAAQSLREHNFAFLAAPNYHPNFRTIAPARKLCAQLGKRTIFNLIGPLLNPVRPDVQLMGVPSQQFCNPIAQVLRRMKLKRAMVVCGKTGAGFLDEISTVGVTLAVEVFSSAVPFSLGNFLWAYVFKQVQEREVRTLTFKPEQFNLSPTSLRDLRGGDKIENAEIIRRLFIGKERGPKRDAVAMNAGAALFLAERVPSIKAGISLALDIITSGVAARKLRDLKS
jgi:anthranilate phosphoribosyltransferase